MAGRLQSKISLVTGGASGIGLEVVKLFANEGSALCIADSNEEKLNQISANLANDGFDHLCVALDVSQSESVNKGIAECLNRFQKIDVLVHCAGIFPSDDGGILDTNPDTFDKVIQVNLKGTYLINQKVVAVMLRTGGGSIVNIASFVAFMGAATAQVAYTASKGGVLSFTRELAVELARKNIRVNALCPGPIETPLLEELLRDEERRNRRLIHIPMGRFGRADEIAKAALFLASDEASFVTGASLLVDGGITAAYVTPE